ncbi:hypothetical protein CFOL_v3_28784 [Cephalotus follicularis]|uniref:Uncharacterized protein n=1 Tax=Cephalotus follicularis TaxID=3775 RepID=A0A1Q3CYM0_CEPFO|nr:hypothetical protein CFOL_v3_28784 [Cephalotus follicularis]
MQQYTHSKRLKSCVEEEVISFSDANLEGVHLSHDNPVVVTLQVELFTTKTILLDSGRSADILYKHTFDQLRIPANQLKPVKTPLVGFAGEIVIPCLPVRTFTGFLSVSFSSYLLYVGFMIWAD